jgi:hypothetical protein
MIFTHQWVPDLKLRKTTADDGTRVYMTPNGPMESVTTFLKRTWAQPYIKEWQKRVGIVKANDIRDKAAKRGKSFHSTIESYLLNEPLDFTDSPNNKILFYRIKDLLDRQNNIRLMEKTLYSDELNMAGSPDTISDFDNELAVIDYKTNSFASKTKFDIIPYFLQAACYAIMFNERFGAMPQKAVIIVASPQAPKGILWTHPMSECIQMLHRFRSDPVAFQALIPTRTKGTPKTAHIASNAVIQKP